MSNYLQAQIIDEIGPGSVLAGRFEVRQILGRGGFGIVYLVYDPRNEAVYAVKTIPESHQRSDRLAERFRQEAQVWLRLGRHPNVVEAHFVDEAAGRLFLAMEFVAPDDRGINTLEGHLRAGPIPVDAMLRWAIHVSYGLEYAYEHGLGSHRDIKPSNILIDQGGLAKITDLGLARVPEVKEAFLEIDLTTYSDDLEHLIYTRAGQGLGTPTHMPPEQFADASICDERSDIYALGVVLYQSATGGRLPFHANPPQERKKSEYERYLNDMRSLHEQAALPRISSPLEGMIRRCLAKHPDDRFSSFSELRTEAQQLLESVTGSTVPSPSLIPLDVAALTNRGYSFLRLKELGRAEFFFSRALQLDARDATAWNGQGLVLEKKGRTRDALACFTKAGELLTGYVDAHFHQGRVLERLGIYHRALDAYERALEIDWSNIAAWNDLAKCHSSMRTYDRALGALETAAKLDDDNRCIRLNLALQLSKLGRHQEALDTAQRNCTEPPERSLHWAVLSHLQWAAGHAQAAVDSSLHAISINPTDRHAWCTLGIIRLGLRQFDRADDCFKEAIELAPDIADFWTNRGVCAFQQHSDAAEKYLRTAVSLDPNHHNSWYNRATFHLLRHEANSALESYSRSLGIRPEDPYAWYNLGLSHHLLGRYDEARQCYDHAVGVGFSHDIVQTNLEATHRKKPPALRPMPSFRPSALVRPLSYAEYQNLTDG